MTGEPEPIINHDEAMRIFDNSEEMWREICADFLVNIPQELARLDQAAAANSTEDLITFTHRIAGAAGLIGATRFRMSARKAELSLRDGKPLDPAAVTALHALFVELKQALEKLPPLEVKPE